MKLKVNYFEGKHSKENASRFELLGTKTISPTLPLPSQRISAAATHRNNTTEKFNRLDGLSLFIHSFIYSLSSAMAFAKAIFPAFPLMNSTIVKFIFRCYFAQKINERNKQQQQVLL